MIYLIDDNKSNQQEKYGCSFIKQGIYHKHLAHLIGVPTPERADFLEELPNKAGAVFFHNTSKDLDKDGNFLETDETIKKVSSRVKDSNTPYVSFSWNHTSHTAIINDGNIESINKRIFYLNLREFIEDYIRSGIMDFEILARGAGYKKEILIEQAQKLIEVISKKDSLEPFMLPEEPTFGAQLENYLTESHSKHDINSFCSIHSHKISNYEFIDMIRKSIISIRKYGRNLYY